MNCTGIAGVVEKAERNEGHDHHHEGGLENAAEDERKHGGLNATAGPFGPAG
jgi:hypothetical protein